LFEKKKDCGKSAGALRRVRRALARTQFDAGAVGVDYVNAYEQHFPHESLRKEGRIMRLLFAATTLGLAIVANTVQAAEPSEKDAIALVEKGAAFMKANGKQELIKRINSKDPEFYHGELYLHMRDAKTGIMVAHPVNPALIGKDLTDVPDTTGKKYRRDIIELAASKGKGWVDYTYKNPADGKVEKKNTYIMRVGDVTLESGIYKN
jgi:hypothetical protein